MIDEGEDCTCGAYGKYECGCEADWTPKIAIEVKEIIRSLLPPHKMACAQSPPLTGQYEKYKHDIMWFTRNGKAVITKESCRCDEVRTARDLLDEWDSPIDPDNLVDGERLSVMRM